MIDPTPILKEIEFMNKRAKQLAVKNEELQSTITEQNGYAILQRDVIKQLEDTIKSDHDTEHELCQVINRQVETIHKLKVIANMLADWLSDFAIFDTTTDKQCEKVLEEYKELVKSLNEIKTT
jgi:regulator of replication initiation timing